MGNLFKENIMNKNQIQCLYPRITVTRQLISLDGMWRFRLDLKNEGRTLHWEQNINTNQMIPVPASFQDFSSPGAKVL